MTAIGDLEIGLCWGTLVQAQLPALIEAAGRHDFPTLSVRPDMVLDTIADGVSTEALRRMLRDAGVRVRVIDAIGAGLPGGRAPTANARGVVVGSADTCLAVAEAVGAPIVNICHYADWLGGPIDVTAMTDAIGSITIAAARRGLSIVMEFVPDTGIPDLATARAIVEGVALPNCSILLDPWHLARTGGTVADVEGLPAGMLGAFQLNDRTPPAPGAAYVAMAGRDLPGEGRLPLADLARAALANNPALTAEVEVFSDGLRGLSVDEAAARVRSAVDRWQREAAIG